MQLPPKNAIDEISRRIPDQADNVTAVLRFARDLIGSKSEAGEDLRYYLTPELDLLYTPDEVAAALNVSRRWLWRMCREGRIPHTRISDGRNIRFSRDNMEALRKVMTRGVAE